MKNFARILAFMLVAVMCFTMLVSCAKPNSDPAEAEKALEKAGYEATKVTLGGVTTVTAFKSANDGISIIYYEKSSDAKDAYKKLKEETEKAGDKAKNTVIGRSGKMVWTASSKDAVKAAK